MSRGEIRLLCFGRDLLEFTSRGLRKEPHDRRRDNPEHRQVADRVRVRAGDVEQHALEEQAKRAAGRARDRECASRRRTIRGREQLRAVGIEDRARRDIEKCFQYPGRYDRPARRRVHPDSQQRRQQQERHPSLLRHSEAVIDDLLNYVRPIVQAVKDRGDEALIKFMARFDRVALTPERLRVGRAEIDRAHQLLDKEVYAAIKHAIENVRRFHEHQMPHEQWFTQVAPGVLVGEKSRRFLALACMCHVVREPFLL